jgi:hypothetical protein
MATDNPTATPESEPESAFDLRDDIHKKLSQAKGICEVIRTNREAPAINRSISDSLWAVDELLEDAKNAVNELYKQVQS